MPIEVVLSVVYYLAFNFRSFPYKRACKNNTRKPNMLHVVACLFERLAQNLALAGFAGAVEPLHDDEGPASGFGHGVVCLM